MFKFFTHESHFVPDHMYLDSLVGPFLRRPARWIGSLASRSLLAVAAFCCAFVIFATLLLNNLFVTSVMVVLAQFLSLAARTQKDSEEGLRPEATFVFFATNLFSVYAIVLGTFFWPQNDPTASLLFLVTASLVSILNFAVNLLSDRIAAEDSFFCFQWHRVAADPPASLGKRVLGHLFLFKEMRFLLSLARRIFGSFFYVVVAVVYLYLPYETILYIVTVVSFAYLILLLFKMHGRKLF